MGISKLKLKKLSVLLPSVLLLLLLFLVSGCTSVAQEKQAAESYSVTDDFGNVLRFSKKPVKIVGSTVSIEEVLLDLVPPQRIAAVSEAMTDKEYSLALDKALLVKGRMPNKPSVEAIAALRPDLVFMQVRDHAAADTLTEMGIKVFRMDTPVSLAMVRKRIEVMGRAAGEPERGAALLKELDRKIAFVKKRTGSIPRAERKTVIAFSNMGATGSATGLFHQICEESGVINGGAATGVLYSEKISDERIIAVNPDIFIVTNDGPENDYGHDIERRILEDEALKNVKAVAEHRFIFLKNRYKYANSQFFGDAVMTIAKETYPDLFTGQ